MREKQLEQKFAAEVRTRGGIAPKLVCPSFDGMPDRLVLMPSGKLGFVEVKAPGERPRPLQEARMRLLKKLGYKVFILDGTEQIGGIIDEICSA